LPAGKARPNNEFASHQPHAKGKHVQFESECATKPPDHNLENWPANSPPSPQISAGKLLRGGGGRHVWESLSGAEHMLTINYVSFLDTISSIACPHLLGAGHDWLCGRPQPWAVLLVKWTIDGLLGAGPGARMNSRKPKRAPDSADTLPGMPRIKSEDTDVPELPKPGDCLQRPH